MANALVGYKIVDGALNLTNSIGALYVLVFCLKVLSMRKLLHVLCMNNI